MSASPVKHTLFAFLLAALLVAGFVAVPALAKTITTIQGEPVKVWVVNTTLDLGADCAPASCTLRQAIIAANITSGPDVIIFNIPISDTNYNATDKNWLITLKSALPALADEKTAIDAHSQPSPSRPEPAPQVGAGISACGTPLIVIDASAASYGFEVTGPNIDLFGLDVYGAQTSGIYIHGTKAKDAHVMCNHIRENGGDGVKIADSASHNIIGDNLIFSNSGDGVEINQANQNGVEGNYIGVDAAGKKARPNSGNGVLITSSAISNTVFAPWNGLSLISGNTKAGVLIESGSTGNIVNNVFIGLGADQKTLIANQDGVVISKAKKNQVTNNLIDGNKQDGVVVTGGLAQENAILANDIGTNPHQEKLGNARFGVLLGAESSQTLLSDNKIMYNGYSGDYKKGGGVVIQLSSSQNTFIRNAIAHNAGDGVLITGADRNRLDGNSIHHNTLQGINLESGGNGDLPAPEITSYVIQSTSVALEAIAEGCPDCVFEVFSDDNGEGEYCEGWGMTDSSGKLTWSSGLPKKKTYTLTVTDQAGNTSEFSAAPVFLDLAIDDALPHVTVNKLIGDTTEKVGKTIVEVATKITGYDAGLTSNYSLTLTIPGNVLGAPTRVFYRDTISDLDGTAITNYKSPSSGVFQLSGISLKEVATTSDDGSTTYSYERLIVFRFAMPDTMTANSLLKPTGSLKNGIRALARSTDWARINAVHQVDGIVVTNRTLLYDMAADNDDSTQLLHTTFSMAQGPPNEPRAPVLAVYYVDQYSTTAKDWDNTAVDYTNATTANKVSVLIDNMTNDWFEDSITKSTIKSCLWLTETVPVNVDSFTIVILGDDDVIPYYRTGDPVTDLPTTTVEDDDIISDSSKVLYHLTANNYFFTDNPYADIFQGICEKPRSWELGGVEAYLGRIVGNAIVSSASGMEMLIKSGLEGPGLDQTNGAIVASYGGYDADPIEAEMNAYPLTVLNSTLLVDEDDWRLTDLLDTMEDTTGWVAFHHGGPAEYGIWHAPEDTWEILTGPKINSTNILSNTMKLHPVVSSFGCRSGLSLGYLPSYLWSITPVYGWASAGASSIMGPTGISYGSDIEGTSLYGEDLLQNYWKNLLNLKKYQVSTGLALQLNKANYTPGISWQGEEKKTVQEYILFGLPWVGFYSPATSPRPALPNLRAALPEQELAWAVSQPSEVSANTYVVTTTVDASEYAISQVSGFDLVNVQGLQLDYTDNGPVLPFARLSMPLPLGSMVQEVQVTPQDAQNLGALQIPMFSPALPMPGGPKDTYRETPASFGVYPTQLYSATVTSAAGSQIAQITAFPLVYDAATNQATLYRRLQVRITYQVPTPVGLLGFSADPANTGVGTPLHLQATLLNASNQPIVVAGVLNLTNYQGETVDSRDIPPFTIPAGSQEYAIALDWMPGAPEGAYHLELEVWRGSDPHMHARQPVVFTARRLSELWITPWVRKGLPAILKTTIDNLSDEGFNGQIFYTIYNTAGMRLAEMAVPVALPAHKQTTLETPWDVPMLPPGAYTISALVTNQDMTASYGPLQQEFVVLNSLFMPLVNK